MCVCATSGILGIVASLYITQLDISATHNHNAYHSRYSVVSVDECARFLLLINFSYTTSKQSIGLKGRGDVVVLCPFVTHMLPVFL